MRKFIAALAVTGLVAGGVVAVSAAVSPDVAEAVQAEGSQELPDRQGPMESVLDELVADGVLTQDQADQVLEAFRAKITDHRRHMRRGFALLHNSAEIIGLDMPDLISALGEGSTLADIAEANGTDSETLIDELVAIAEARIDEAVEAGHLDPSEADAKKADAADKITEVVNNPIDLPERPFPPRRGPGRPGGPGPFGGGEPGADNAGSTF